MQEIDPRLREDDERKRGDDERSREDDERSHEDDESDSEDDNINLSFKNKFPNSNSRLELRIDRVEGELHAGTQPAVVTVVAIHVREVFVLAETASHIKAEPAVHLHLVERIYQVLGFFHAGGGILAAGEGHVVVGVHFLVALAQPCESERERVLTVLPAEIEPQVESVGATAVAYRVIHKIGVGVIGVVLFAVVAAVVAAARVLEEREPAIASHGVGAHHVKPPAELAVERGRKFVIVAHEVVDYRAARALVIVLAHRAVDVFHVYLAIELRAVARLVAEFHGGRRRRVAGRVVVVPVDERAHGAELGSLAAYHALLCDVNPELFGLDAELVEHEGLDVVVVGAVALVCHLIVALGAFLRVGLGTHGRAAGRMVNHIAVEPGVERAEQEIVAEHAGSKFPAQAVMVGGAAHQDVVPGNLQVVEREPPELHVAHGVFPHGVGVVRHVYIEFARVVREILVKVILVPGLEIAPERGFQKHVETLVAGAETEGEERVEVFLVTAGGFERNLQATPVAPEPVGGIYREGGVGGAAVEPEVEIGAYLEIAAFARLRGRRVCMAQGSQAKCAEGYGANASAHALQNSKKKFFALQNNAKRTTQAGRPR